MLLAGRKQQFFTKKIIIKNISLNVSGPTPDGKRLSWMEYESYKSACLRRRLPALDASEDSELELTTLSAIKVDSTLTTSLWPLHDRDPFFVIGEKPMV